MSLGEGGLKVRYSLVFQQSHSCGFACLRLLLNTVQLNKYRPLSCPHILHGWCHCIIVHVTSMEIK